MSQEPVHPRSQRSILFMFAGLALLTAIDLGSKEWALHNLSTPRRSARRPEVCQLNAYGETLQQRRPGEPRPLIDGVLNLYYAENCGAAFSMLRTAPSWVRLALFGTASSAATLVLIGMFVRGAGGPLFAAGVPLIVSGAIGNNLSDRPRHGFVVDFLQIDPSLFRYPVFNVADIWIAVGVALLLLDGLRKAPKAAGDATAAAPLSAKS